MTFTTRFAPSPTGFLHLGHAFSALTAFDAARAAGGRFLLRIEDTDQGRCRPHFEAAIYEDLAWLGVAWETPVLRQSEHMADYAAVLERLIAMGVAYRCFRTRRELLLSLAHAPHDKEALYVGAPLAPAEEAERIERGEAYAWRLSVARVREVLGARADTLVFEDQNGRHAVDPGKLGDVVIARKEFPASYHIASVWDDARQGVTCVIRGEDLIDSAHLHVTLQALLDLPTPTYRQHPLILSEDGRRLAKRDAALSLRSLRESGVTPAGVRGLVGLAPA